MHYHLRYLSLVTTPLLWALISPLLPLTSECSPLVAGTRTTYNQSAEVKWLFSTDVEPLSTNQQRDTLEMYARELSDRTATSQPFLVAQNQPTAKIEGTWTIAEAQTSDGKKYTGSVIIQSVGRLYSLFWKTSTGNRSGLAFLEDGRLFVGWGTDEEAGSGIVIYKIGKDGTLEGKWTTASAGGEIGTEKLTGGTPGQVEGDYQVVGTNPGSGGRYKGVLNIRKTGDTYQLSWAVGTSFRGVGMRTGDWLIVSWGQSNQLGVTDFAIQGNGATGRWALFNQPKLGVENLVRRQNVAQPGNGNASDWEFDK